MVSTLITKLEKSETKINNTGSEPKPIFPSCTLSRMVRKVKQSSRFGKCSKKKYLGCD